MNKSTSNHYPVVIFLFRRPQYTLELLNKITKAKTTKIYIFIDAPKTKEDELLVNQNKTIVKDYAKSHTNLNLIITSAQKNLGLKQSIIKGVTQVFKKESAAIILEDDCVPSLDFFKFTNQMLTKYKDNSKVMSVTGSGTGNQSLLSYDFSRYQQSWGWATWRRAWKLYDPSLKGFKEDKWKAKSKSFWSDIYMRRYFNTMLKLTKKGQVPSWAFKWSFAHFLNDGLAILPSGNLINNIGFDKAATNTRTNSPLSSIKITKMSFPLKHPKKVQENLKLSKTIEKMYYKNIIAFLGMTRQLILYNLKRLVK